MTMQATAIARPPSSGENMFDRAFRGATLAFAWLIMFLVLFIVWQISVTASPAIQEFGLSFIATENWDNSKEEFGILPEIWGTLYSSILGVAVGAAFGVAVAIFLTQDFLPPRLEVFVKNVVELLAAIPSVVYGLWGIFVLIPAIRPACDWLHDHLGWIPVFDTRLSGPGILPASLVLAIMIMPTVTAISRDAIASVPTKLREASFGLGATLWETILAVVLPTAARGIWGSIILAFGRALGETMALAMLAGNSNEIHWSVLAPANTLAALLANKFQEASPVEMGALMYAALVLLAITMTVNVFGTIIVQRSSIQGGR